MKSNGIRIRELAYTDAGVDWVNACARAGYRFISDSDTGTFTLPLAFFQEHMGLTKVSSILARLREDRKEYRLSFTPVFWAGLAPEENED